VAKAHAVAHNQTAATRETGVTMPATMNQAVVKVTGNYINDYLLKGACKSTFFVMLFHTLALHYL